MIFKSKKCSYRRNFSSVEKCVMNEIGYYFFKKCTGSSIEEVATDAYRVITDLGIHDVRFENKIFGTSVVHVHLERPGLLIGKAGKDIEAITDKLIEVLKIKVKIHIIEQDPNSHLTGFLSYMTGGF